MKKAFTLIELLIVIAIIAILAGVIFVNLNSARNRAKDARVKSDMSELSKALEIVKVDRDLNNTGVTFGWSVINNTSNDDFNITHWTDINGNQLISTLPKHPINNTSYWMRIMSNNNYAFFTSLSANQHYWCIYNGSGREITASGEVAARSDCLGI